MSLVNISKAEDRGDYFVDGNLISLKQIGNLIREGHEIVVKDTQDLDFTKEILVKVAFEGHIPLNVNTKYVFILAEFVSESDLLLIIENGGYDSFVQRRGRQALFEGSYYFDKITETVDTYLKHGKNREDITNYLDNLIRGIQ